MAISPSGGDRVISSELRCVVPGCNNPKFSVMDGKVQRQAPICLTHYSHEWISHQRAQYEDDDLRNEAGQQDLDIFLTGRLALHLEQLQQRGLDACR